MNNHQELAVYDIILPATGQRIGQAILSRTEFLKITGMHNVLSPSRNLALRELAGYVAIYPHAEKGLSDDTLVYLSAYLPGKDK
jgi:hypothetical protein